MKFPAYVPAAVRELVTRELEGDEDIWEGWFSLLNKSKAELDDIEHRMSSIHDSEYLDELRRKKVEEQAHLDSIQADVNCYLRLINDQRMQEVYAILTNEFIEDDQFKRFVEAARVAALFDYAVVRDRLKRVKEHSKKIAKTVEKLSGLYSQISDLGYQYWPPEMYGLPELLRKTDNHSEMDRNYHMWRSLRHYILGDRSQRENELAARENVNMENYAEIEFNLIPSSKKTEIDPEQQRRNHTHYVWGVAPDFPELLKTVHKAALDFIPEETGLFKAALVSREHNTAMEYIRAFGYRLSEESGLELTAGVMRAMAITANVAINNSEIDIGDGDVRQALAKLN